MRLPRSYHPNGSNACFVGFFPVKELLQNDKTIDGG
jgi:hypothetical protein